MAQQNHHKDDLTPRELWEELGSYSTLHGFRFTFNKSSKVRRTLWVFLIIGSGSFLCNQIYSNFKKVMAHQVVFKYRSETRETIDFPAVSICNNNMMRKSKINGTVVQRYLDLLDPQMREKWPELESGMNYSVDMESAARQYGHNLTQMMPDGKCEWPGKPCTEDNFTAFFERKYGICYTFNSGKDGKKIVSTDNAYAGVTRGFSVVLDTQPYEYYGPYSYRGTGFRVMIHDQTERKSMEKHSLQISPGFNVEMKITRKELNSLEAPFPTRCTSKKGHSKSLCLRNCHKFAVIRKCNCLISAVDDEEKRKRIPWCTPWQIRECVTKTSAKLALNLPKDCNCPVRCHSVTYDVRSSYMAFPSESYWKTTKYYTSTSPRQLAHFIKDFRNRYVRLDVYFAERKVHITSEEPAYTGIDLANDLGGSMGLFLGCSVMTLFEFVDVLTRMCISRWKKKRQIDNEV